MSDKASTARVLVVTRDGKAIEYKRSEFYIKHTDYGVTIIPKQGHECGWAQTVYPWANIGLVQEKEGK